MIKRLAVGVLLALVFTGAANAAPVTLCDLLGQNCVSVNSDGSLNVKGSTGGGGGAITAAAASYSTGALVDGADTTLGTEGDNAWNLTATSATEIAISKKIAQLLSGGATVVNGFGSPSSPTLVTSTVGLPENLIQIGSAAYALNADGGAPSHITNTTASPVPTVSTAGSAIIGKVGIDQTTPGTSNAVSTQGSANVAMAQDTANGYGQTEPDGMVDGASVTCTLTPASPSCIASMQGYKGFLVLYSGNTGGAANGTIAITSSGFLPVRTISGSSAAAAPVLATALSGTSGNVEGNASGTNLNVTETFAGSTPVTITIIRKREPVDMVAGVVAQGFAPAGAANGGNPVKIGCAYNSTAPVLTTGQVGDTQCDTAGNIRIVGAGTAGATSGGVVTVQGGGSNGATLPVQGYVGYSDSNTALAASATFTGTARTAAAWGRTFKCKAYADQTGTLQLQESDDSGSTYQTAAQATITAAGVSALVKEDLTGTGASLYRCVVANGATAETVLRLTSAFGTQ